LTVLLSIERIATGEGVKRIHVGAGENENLFMTLVNERR